MNKNENNKGFMEDWGAVSGDEDEEHAAADTNLKTNEKPRSIDDSNDQTRAE